MVGLFNKYLLSSYYMPDTVLISTLDTKGRWNSHKWQNTMGKCCSELQMAWVGARVETGRLMEGFCSSPCWMRPWKEEIRKNSSLKREDGLKISHYEVETAVTWWLVRCSELREEPRFVSGFSVWETGLIHIYTLRHGLLPVPFTVAIHYVYYFLY